MKLNAHTLSSIVRRGLWSCFAVLALTLVFLPAAQANGRGAPKLADEDGIGTLPLTFAPPTGLLLIGTVPELVATVTSVNRAPELVSQLPDGRWAVGFGSASLIELDRAALRAFDVRVYLSAGAAFDGADAAVSTTAGASFGFQLQSELLLQLPLAELFGPGTVTPTMMIDAFAGDGAHYRTVFAPAGSVIRIGQLLLP